MMRRGRGRGRGGFIPSLPSCTTYQNII